MDKTKTLSLCMIVKNEDKYLAQCIESVKDIVDEIIIVDTGSTDRTIEIANKFSAKVYNYKWKDDFSKARNFAISKVTSEWILLLDADEEVRSGECEKIIDFINRTSFDGCHFNVYNYTGDGNKANYSVHNAFRLLRNDRKYKFKGEIHEQIVRCDSKEVGDAFTISDIIINHYGYLDSVINEKKKRDRNVPLILKQLETDPKNAFYLFNLGNEYLAKQDIEKALETYNNAMNYVDRQQPYAPHLMYRRLTCFIQLKKYEEAIVAANEALMIYVDCTDIEYCKGIVYFEWNKPTLAIDSFNKCIDMGEPPAYIKFINDCGDFRPYLSLGELYFSLGDYDKAIDNYNKALNINKSAYYLLYKIGEILKKQYKDKNIVSNKMLGYFSSQEYLPNIILFTDILINSNINDIAEVYADKILDRESENIDGFYLKGKINFYKKDYTKAYDNFIKAVSYERSDAILGNIKKESLQFLFIIALLESKYDLSSILALIQSEKPLEFSKIYEELSSIHSNSEMQVLTGEEDPIFCLQIVAPFLDKLLKVKEFDLFNESVDILNKINSKDVLIYLGKLYHQNGLEQLAVKTIFQSLEQLGVVDRESINILYESILQ